MSDHSAICEILVYIYTRSEADERLQPSRQPYDDCRHLCIHHYIGLPPVMPDRYPPNVVSAFRDIPFASMPCKDIAKDAVSISSDQWE
jgi:hypothetical protein